MLEDLEHDGSDDVSSTRAKEKEDRVRIVEEGERKRWQRNDSR